MAIVDPASGFEIRDRDVVSYGVPTIRSGSKYGNDVPTALDIMPKGSPASTSYGASWIHVCNADLIANPSAPVDCAYIGSHPDHTEIGSMSFNGSATKPLFLRIGNTIVGKLTDQGLEIFGYVKANSFGGAPLPFPEDGELWSYAFGGNENSSIAIPPAGIGDFCYSWWMKGSQTLRADLLTQANGYNSTGWYGLLLNVSTAGTISWYEKTTAKIVATCVWNDGNPHHIEISRTGGTLRLFFDGNCVGSASSSFSYGATGISARLGMPTYSAQSFIGKVDDLVIGSAGHTANFTPPERQDG